MDKILTKEIIAPICIIIGAIVLINIINKIIKKIFSKKINKNHKKQETVCKLIGNIVKYLIIIIAIMMILEVFGIDTKSLIASFGIIGLVAGLALQDMIKDLIAGIVMVFENSYNVGDYVKINNFIGTVIELGAKSTRIKSDTGEVKKINNGSITEVINYSIYDLSVIVDIDVSYDSDLLKVQKVLNDFCKNVRKELEDVTDDIKLLGVQELKESGISFRILAPVKPGSQYKVKRELNMLLKIELDKNNIVIPYPHMVIANE